ncbi:cation:proton antiporter [Agromyces marinus]|uniref:DUF4129 domain-containing protein n=1 Tax=Agromyces marinus TaxID=1389020 RepID=A0ABM8H5W3_9MICO|nr:hypothetical protein [Agromyces marinus]UIP58827.1 hypothetical protein DSM26151_17140 [Agromyces marinus]BDZ56228.1 hypothetical protein GCM10025870_33010 [Agromyces marinus]
MQWWNDFVDWLFADGTRPVLFTAAVVFVSVLVAGLLAAWISRSAVRGLIRQRDRELRRAAIATLIDAATEASVWNSLTPQEQVLADRAVGQADIQVRLLPVRGSDVAADWATHQLHELKRASATFGYQLDPAVVEFRDRMLEWQRHPSRTRRDFRNDLDRWRAQREEPRQSLAAEQDSWVAEQHHERYAQSPLLEDESAPSQTQPIAPIAPAADVDASADADTDRRPVAQRD